LTNEIIYTNLAAKPKPPTPAPTPEAPEQASAPQVKRISWGIQGRLHMPATAERSHPRKDDSSAPRVRPSCSSSSAMRSAEARSYSEGPSRIEMGRVERYSRLERLPEQRLLSEKLERQAARPVLEHLTILYSPKAQQYWIADVELSEVFLPQAFATLKHCHEAAAELERTFAIAQVLEMRSPETMESVGELVREHWLRERVTVALG
jgi:hypothetical protein